MKSPLYVKFIFLLGQLNEGEKDRRTIEGDPSPPPSSHRCVCRCDLALDLMRSTECQAQKEKHLQNIGSSFPYSFA